MRIRGRRRPWLVGTGAVVALAVVAALLVAAVTGIRPRDLWVLATGHQPPGTVLPVAGDSGSLNVLGLGDSVMAGTNCDCDGIPQEYAEALAGTTARGVRSANLGVAGDTTTALLDRLRHDSATRTDVARAGVVLVTEGANDLAPLLDRWRDDGCGAECYRPAVEKMAAHLTTALTTIRAQAPAQAQVLVTGYWNVLADGEAALADGGRAEVEWSRTLSRAADAAIHEAARSTHTTYVDLTDSFLGDGTHDPTPLLAEDGDHPNQAGVRAIVADLVHATRPVTATG